jgi:Ca2+-transporting ATPase
VWVLRDGRLVQVPSREVVPGDWLRLESGDRLLADGILREAQGAMLDESILTGESLPLDRASGDEALSGTLLVRGTAYLEATRTGAYSNLGQLAQMIGQIAAGKTPLEERLDQLGQRLARWVLGLAVIIALAGLLAEGREHLGEIVLFAVALAVAAVPEGLPAVLTLTLALGVERMARRKAVVRKLAAVEALGSVTLIATDKTGTLTENRMEVRLLDSPDVSRALQAMVLANDADGEGQVGDPLDLGLWQYALPKEAGLSGLRKACPRLSARAFDSDWKFMRVTVEQQGKPVSYLKGAPEVLLPRCRLEDHHRASWQEKALAYATEGYRVLGLAWGEGECEQDLRFLGLALFWDPPRSEVPEAMHKAQQAGIRVVMVTGDHPATALAVAHKIGIEGERVLTGEDLEDYDQESLKQAVQEVNVFARVHPKHKLALVEALQAQGQSVAMTGDGVNDAPALKRSNVGVAMGQRGSDVTREVADLVLLDDNFATVVSAIEEGRSIYENVQKFLRFLFSTNLSEVIVVAVGALLAFALGLRETDGSLLLPLTAVQILWINLVTDGLPALSLALDRNPGVMQRPPNPPQSPLLDGPSLRFVVLSGTIKACIALGILGLVPMLGYSLDIARSTCFHFVAIGQLFFTYPARHTHLYPLPNPVLHGVVIAGIAIQVVVGSIPGIAAALDVQILPMLLWMGILGSSLLAWGITEGLNRVFWTRKEIGRRKEQIGR